MEGELNASALVYIELPQPMPHATVSNGRVFLDVPCLGFKTCDLPLLLPESIARNLILPSVVNGTMLTDEFDTIDHLRPSEREFFSSVYCEKPSEEVAVRHFRKTKIWNPFYMSKT